MYLMSSRFIHAGANNKISLFLNTEHHFMHVSNIFSLVINDGNLGFFHVLAVETYAEINKCLFNILTSITLMYAQN
jgi:hypothetical protein